jgi:hypothetical protein
LFGELATSFEPTTVPSKDDKEDKQDDGNTGNASNHPSDNLLL